MQAEGALYIFNGHRLVDFKVHSMRLLDDLLLHSSPHSKLMKLALMEFIKSAEKN